jgi:ribose 5-phosphate isomerase B
MKIALGADHAGFDLKEKIKEHLIGRGISVEDLGTHSDESVDYPDYARAVGEEIVEKRSDLGVLVCGTGIGMCIAANKIPGIRAANVHTEMEAQLAREHNNANVLTLGGRTLDEDTAFKLLDCWLSAKFAGGRHGRRVEKVSQMERAESQSPASI